MTDTQSTADILALMRAEPYEAGAYLDQLEAALLDAPLPAIEMVIHAVEAGDTARALAALDRFEALATARPNKDTLRDDLLTVVKASRVLIPAGKEEAALVNLHLVPRLLLDTAERPCMRPKRSCPTPECQFRFVGDGGRDLWICPECGAGRTLCRNRGEPRCRYHKGAKRRGIHGLSKRYQFSNQTIEELFEAQMERPDLLNLEQDVALASVRIGILTGRLNELDFNLSGRDAGHFNILYGRFREALDGETYDLALDVARDALRFVSSRIEENAAWHEVERAQDHKRRLVETESKRAALQESVISPEQLIQFMITLSSMVEMAVARHLQDARLRRKIIMDVGSGVDSLMRGDPVPQRMLPGKALPAVDGQWAEEKD